MRSTYAVLLGVVVLLLAVAAGRADELQEKSDELMSMAKARFPSMSEAQETALKKLFDKVIRGEVADYSDPNEDKNDPAGAAAWGAERVLAASHVEWLCTDPAAAALVTHRGMWIRGARIDGRLDLSFARLPFPIGLFRCAILDGLNLHDASIPALYLNGTWTGPLIADGIEIRGDLFLRDGFTANGEVRLPGAKIGGNLECDASHFHNEGDVALFADGAKVGGSVFFRNGFTAEGEVRLLAAKIGGVLDCSGGHFHNKGKIALYAAGAEVNGAVFLRNGFTAEGVVRLLGAKTGGDLDCNGGHFHNKGKDALSADGAQVDGGVFLANEFTAEGAVRLPRAKINGILDCSGGHFHNEENVALLCDRAQVNGTVFLRDGFTAQGEVRLLDAIISGNLDCSGGHLHNQGNVALLCDRAQVNGTVFLRNGFTAEGEVRLLDAIIGGNLNCNGGDFHNEGNGALSADGAEVSGNVFFRDGVEVRGRVSFVGARIERRFVWTGVRHEGLTLDLRSARIGTLWDNPASWPVGGKLHLNGLVYDELAYDAPMDTESRLNWLRRQPDYRPQPYEQLAAVLRSGGHEAQAKSILIGNAKDRARLTKLSWPQRSWHLVSGPIIGYGYRPWRAFWIGVWIVIVGWLLFLAGDRAGLMKPTDPNAYSAGAKPAKMRDDYPKLNALAYSIDVFLPAEKLHEFLPVVKLYQVDYWQPSAGAGRQVRIGGLTFTTGGLLWLWRWFEFLAGWTLTMLLVVYFSGLVRSERARIA